MAEKFFTFYTVKSKQSFFLKATLIHFQLCEGLTFLHDSVKLLHHNLSPDSIILNEAGAWKIFGFDFALPNISGANEPPKWKCSNQMESCEDLMPDLDFLAPEYAIEDDDILTPATDMFSLGMLAFTCHNSKPLFTNSGSWSNFRRNCSEVCKLHFEFPKINFTKN